MYTVADLERLTGLSRKQVYDRLRELSGILEEHITIGRNGKKLLSEQGFAIFNRLLELEREGQTREAALQTIVKERSTDQGKEGKLWESESKPEGNPELIRSLQLTIEILREENRWLRKQIEELQQRALPPPQRPRRFWAWWRRNSA